MNFSLVVGGREGSIPSVSMFSALQFLYKSITCNHSSNFEAFDCNPSLEVISVFLDISKAFDKVWDKGLLYKLESMAISGEVYKLIENYLCQPNLLIACSKLTIETLE